MDPRQKEIQEFIEAYEVLVLSKQKGIDQNLVFTTCPKCGYKEAIKMQSTKRALDEESTEVIKCSNCGAE